MENSHNIKSAAILAHHPYPCISISMQQRIPFYRRLRFSMILTVLLVVALTSGTSILISYSVIGDKIEKDVHEKIAHAEKGIDAYFHLSRRILRLAADATVEAFTLNTLLKNTEHYLSFLDIIGNHEQEYDVDIICLFDEKDGLLEVTEHNRSTAEALVQHEDISIRLSERRPFTVTLLHPVERRFFMISLSPIRLADMPDKNTYVLSGYVLNRAFLERIPPHPHVFISIVSDNIVLASTLSSDILNRKYTGFTSSVLLPGALDLIHESSFFHEKMYLKTSYLPWMRRNSPDFIILSHPSKLVLATKKEFGQHFLILFFVGLCCSIILVYFITGSVLNPISELKNLVRKISEGDISTRIESRVSNEFTPLINQFNHMLDLLQRKDEELSERVEAKTYELQQQNIFIDNLLCSSQVMAIAATDMDLRITYFNPVAEKLFGYTADTVIGKKVTKFQSHIRNREEEFNQLIALALEKGSHTFTISTSDLQNYDLDNLKVGQRNRRYQQTIEVYLSPIRARTGEDNETITGLMLMAQDISKARQMDERLRAALAELQVIIDNTMLGLVLVQDNRVIRVNSTFEKMFGYSFEEIQELSWSSFYSLVFAGKEARCWDGSGQMFFMNRKVEQGLEPFWSKVRRVAIDSEQQQEVERELFLFEDMSIQNEMFEKIQRLSQAVEQSSNSVVIMDTVGIIEYVNSTFIKITGYKASEVIGQNLALLAPDESTRRIYEGMWTAVLAGEEWTGELVNKKKDGELYEESVVVSPLRNEQEEITHIIATKENITDLKKARQQADSANKAKSEFLANMSHEIRTPMNSIIGMTELLLDSELLPEQKGYIENVNSSASVLLSLINDILDFSKIEAGKLELDIHPFNPKNLIEEILATLKILAEQKGIALRLEVRGEADCLLQGDSLRIRQVLLNLVGNSIKFTRKGHVILSLDIQSQDVQACSLLFKIIDTGIGISQDQQENIFSNFTQADSSITRKFGGTGLGLAISNRLLQMMGSNISLESNLGMGSIFSFTLLLPKGNAAQHALEQQEEEQGYRVQHLDILLVEDHPANQQLAVVILQKQGHNVTVAHNGLEALQYLSKQRYALIFMDMQMPVMDGLSATRYIRQIEQGQVDELPEELVPVAQHLRQRLEGGHLHIIAVTANAMQEDRQQCLDAGMDDYLSKPYKKISFLKILQKLDHQPSTQEPQTNLIMEEQEQHLPVVVWEEVKQHLMQQFDLEAKDAEEVLAAYAHSFHENITGLRNCVDQGAGSDAGRQAHAIKGGLLNLGLNDLANTALVLEKELPQKIEPRHRQMIEALGTALADFVGYEA